MPENKAYSPAEDLELLEGFAREAGKIAGKWFGKNPDVWLKDGSSPVSEADLAVDSFLRNELLKARPDYGWLSEETDDNPDRMKTDRVFVVDPIDGTRGFIEGKKQWCVSIALVEHNRPVAGVLECPALNQTISATLNGGASLNGEPLLLPVSESRASFRVTGPRQLKKQLKKVTVLPVNPTPFVPSLAYRIAMVAMGETDLAIARSSAKDWDLAAADIILHEAGGLLTDTSQQQLEYNCSDVRHGALVASHRDTHNEMLAIALQAR